MSVATRSELAGQPLVDPREEGAPALLRAIVLVGAHVPALLEAHLCAPVAEVGEDDGDELVAAPAGLVGDREDQALGRGHLVVLARPADLAAARAAEHRGPPFAARADVHRDRG